ncbi:hypothetical protein [Halobaculum sp. D14]|uniref:hypothetical protein n=1 Tax=unclassified Halobaculum TaxID=2640896 RepID=UPI003EBF147B
MNVKRLGAVAVVALVVVAGGAAAAFVAGVGPFGGDEESSIEEFPTATPTPTPGSGSSGGGGGGSGTTTATGESGGEKQLPAYYFTVETIDKCGQTCRDVTVELTNNRNETAQDVTVYTRIYAGNTTKQGSMVWEGKEPIGKLQAGASTTETQRVKLSYSEAFSVKQNDGWITILTTVQSAEKTMTFKQRRDVA